MTLSACVNWPLLWTESQIRLRAGDTTPSHGKNAATLPDMLNIPMAQEPDMHMA